jgi:hypothetical protein
VAYIVLAMWGTLTGSSTNAFFISASMATTLAQNLKLDSPPDPGPTGFHALAYGYHPPLTSSRYNGEHLVQRKRTDEERRAVLACFCLSSRSVVSTSGPIFRFIETNAVSSICHKLGTQLMRWTSHMEDCLTHLASNPACENDEVLVIQAKCTRILDTVCACSPNFFRSSGQTSGFPSMHALMAKALKGHVQEVQSHIRPLLLEKSKKCFPWALYRPC